MIIAHTLLARTASRLGKFTTFNLGPALLTKLLVLVFSNPLPMNLTHLPFPQHRLEFCKGA